MDEKPQDDMGFLDYISKTKTRAPAPKLTQLNLDLSTPAEETLTARAPQLQSTVTPTVDPIAPILPKATTPKIVPLNLQTETYTVPTLPTAPKLNLDITALPVSQEVKPSPVQQSQVVEMDYVPSPQQTSPTPADVAFKTTPSKDSKVLTLPPEWTQKDLAKAKELATKWEMSLPEMFGIIGRETGDTYSPATTNEINATGIIQFTPTTSADMLLALKQKKAVEKIRAEAKASNLTPQEEEKNVALARKANPLFWQLGEKDKARAKILSQQAVQKMSVAEQLDLKDMYLEQRTKGKKGVENVYSAIFRGNPNDILIPAGSREYEANKSLDRDGKGGITKAEWMGPVLERARAIKDVRVQEAAKAAKAGPNPPDAAQGTTQQRLVTPGNRPTETNKQDIIEDARKMAILASPFTPREWINNAVDTVPVDIVNPGTPEQEYMDKEKSLGLHWRNNGQELIEVTSGIPKGGAASVLAHEYIHSVKGSPHNDDPNTLMAEDATNIGRSRADGLQAAFVQGAKQVNAEHANMITRLKASNPWLPDFLIDAMLPQVTPSRSAKLKEMRKNSGEPSKNSEVWDTEKK